MKPAPNEVLIIGFGNVMRGDDAVGPYVARKLGGVVAHQLVPEMAEQVAAAKTVYFVDARTDLPPGHVEIMPLEEDHTISHQASPGWLLKVAREVYGSAPEARLAGIGGESFELGAGMSQAARRGALEAIRLIRSIESL